MVAGYLGSLGLTSDAHRGWHSVLRLASRIATELFSRRASFVPWPRYLELQAQCAVAHFINLGSRSHSAYPHAIETLAQSIARQGTVMANGSGVRVVRTTSPLEHIGAVCLPTLRRHRRAARPNHALNRTRLRRAG